MRFTKEELIIRFQRGNLNGLNLAGLVRLSFEVGQGKRERPAVLRSGADINGREDQELRCRLAVEDRGGNYIYTYDEPDTSAWKRRRVRQEDGSYIYRVIRPIYEGALADLKRGVAPNGQPLDGLIVYDLDRLTRDNRHLEDAIDVVEHSGKLITDINLTLDLLTDIGRSNARFLVVAKGIQSTDTARRVRDKHYAMASAGLPVGGSRPFGWNEDRRTLHPLESELLRKARLDILAGVGIHTICREWHEAGIRTPRGNKWVHTVLRNLLLSPRLTGYIVHNQEICRDHEGSPVMGQHQAIFTVQEWEDLQDYLTSRPRTDGYRGARKRLLTGVVRCGLCGTSLRSSFDARHNVHNYACPSPTSGGCGRVSIQGVKLDAMVTEMVLEYLATKEVQTEITPWLHEELLATKRRKIRELMAAYQADELPKEQVFPAVATLNGDIAALKRDHAAWSRQQLRANNTTSDVVALWPTMSVDRQRSVIENVIDTVVINPRTIKARGEFDPARVGVVWRLPAEIDLSRIQAIIRGAATSMTALLAYSSAA